MNKTTLLVASLATLLGLALGCGVPCDMLEDKLCEELGESDCKVWKEAGGPEQIRSGRRPMRACLNAMTGPTFDAHVAGARASVEAIKLAGGS